MSTQMLGIDAKNAKRTKTNNFTRIQSVYAQFPLQNNQRSSNIYILVAGMLNGYPLVDVDPFKLQEHSPSVGGEWHPDEFPDLPTLEETKTFVEIGKEEQVLKFAWVNGEV